MEVFKPINPITSKFQIGISDTPNTFMSIIGHEIHDMTEFDYGTQDLAIFHASEFENSTIDNKTELLTLYILHTISKRYGNHWDLDYNKSFPFLGSVSSIISQKADADNKTTQIDDKTLKGLFSDEHLIQKIQSDLSFQIPKDGKIEIQEDSFVKIKFSDRYLDFEIELSPETSVNIIHNPSKTSDRILSILGLERKESNHLNLYSFVLKTKIQTHKFYRWNPATIRRTEWATELTEYLQGRLGWTEFLKHIEN
ncbi:hypothetical protein [Marinoscillum pacificum]|uniref:hypothetical protein n=1 Tax=Marinoscillum pacificum TaxID=392723 RepID=UPI002158640D|nr:hypothetical protein [Marinoscillum pacificum]